VRRVGVSGEGRAVIEAGVLWVREKVSGTTGSVESVAIEVPRSRSSRLNGDNCDGASCSHFLRSCSLPSLVGVREYFETSSSPSTS
jgi:hypothetical protein